MSRRFEWSTPELATLESGQETTFGGWKDWVRECKTKEQVENTFTFNTWKGNQVTVPTSCGNNDLELISGS